MPSPSFPDLRWGFRSACVWTDKRNVIGGYQMGLAQGLNARIRGSSQSISYMPCWIVAHYWLALSVAGTMLSQGNTSAELSSVVVISDPIAVWGGVLTCSRLLLNDRAILRPSFVDCFDCIIDLAILVLGTTPTLASLLRFRVHNDCSLIGIWLMNAISWLLIAQIRDYSDSNLNTTRTSLLVEGPGPERLNKRREDTAHDVQRTCWFQSIPFDDRPSYIIPATMSCCGEAKPPSSDQKPQNGYPNMQTVNQQPVPHPGLQNPSFQQPTVSPPPNVHQQGAFAQNGFQQQQGWQSSSPPPFNPYSGTNTPAGTFDATAKNTYNGSVNGYPFNEPLARPGSAHTSIMRSQAGSPPHMSVSSPPPMMTIQPPPGQIGQIPGYPTQADEGKMSIAIDFGTTFSGVAYGSSRIAGGQVQQILNWPGSFETFRKIPTCLLYDEYGQILAWGLEAKNATPMPGTTRCEWFKLYLEPHVLRDQSAIDERLPALPPGKRAVDLIVDYLGCLWEYAKEQITREIGAVADLNSADVWLTVPAAWDAKGCDLMREAAISAGLVQSAKAGDRGWRERLRIITEPEAAAVHCAHLTDLHHLKPSQNFIVCDAGGGTVDLAVYKIIGQMANLEIAEMCARSGANCGSLFLDLRFKELVRTLLADHPAHLDPASLAYFMHAFSETDKIAYTGVEDDDNMFHFTCFNVEDPHAPEVGLENGQLSIPGNMLRREVFDPVVEQVLALIEEQTRKLDQRIDALLLVGGFAGCEYLKARVEEQFSSRIRVIERPPDADTATVRGAARYGLARRPLVSSVIAPRSYVMKVKLPADQEDWMKRPAYIRNNDAGVPICENRLQYLVQKGAIIRKGQRVTTKFCKFSQTPQDSTFVAVLYTSETEKVLRYTDEGETVELCKWTVDISTLPTFRQNAANPPPGGFYTEFELGLELDSAEVRGILIFNGQEWGRVTFDFLN